jgi:hypothetical protein
LYRIWPAFALEIAFVLYDLKPKSQKGHAYVFALDLKFVVRIFFSKHALA